MELAACETTAKHQRKDNFDISRLQSKMASAKESATKKIILINLHIYVK